MRFAAVVMAMFLAGCAAPPALLKETASGYPEESLRGVTVEGTRAALMDLCASRGALVQESTVNQVVCGKTMSGMDAVLVQVLIGNQYSTTPELKVRFTIYANGPAVRVTAQQWAETQMAFGQMRRTELNSVNHRNSLQSLLSSLPGAGTSMQAALPVAAPQLAPATPPPVPMSVQGTPAPAATVVATPVMQLPTPAPNPPPSTPTGRDSYVAERLARQAGCSNSDALAQLVAKGAGYESYSMRCTSGDVMMIRCEMGNCRALK